MKTRKVDWSSLSSSERWLLVGHSMTVIGFSCLAFGNLISMLEGEKGLPVQPINPNINNNNNSVQENLYQRKKSYFTS
jgi:hypothetical protein